MTSKGAKISAANWEKPGGSSEPVSWPENVLCTNAKIPSAMARFRPGGYTLARAVLNSPNSSLPDMRSWACAPWLHRPPRPTVSSWRRSSGIRRCRIVVDFVAGLPRTHWSKEVTPMHWRVLSMRTSRVCHMLAGSLWTAHSGYCGCSRNPVPPVLARQIMASNRNRMRRDPIIHCCHGRSFRFGNPKGHVPDRMGGAHHRAVLQL